MNRDSDLVSAAEAWMERAVEDLRAASRLLESEPAIVGAALFHAEQAAEKSMKAFLAWHDIPFRKTHDLGEIGRQCVRIDPSLNDLCARAERLTVFAWSFRYPGETTEPPVPEARDAMVVARSVYEAVRARLPEGTP